MKTPIRCEYFGWGIDLCKDCCEACAYHASCAEHYTEGRTDENLIPAAAIDLMMTAWADLKLNPRDYDKFRTFDWVLNVALRKWQTYARARKVSGT